MQARSRRTLERIVEAALELLADGGTDAVTVHAVVERAGASVGSFYARFPGKDDLLFHLEERVWDEVRARWEEVRASLPEENLSLESAVPALVGALGVVLRVRSRERRALAGRERSLERERAFLSDVRRTVRERLLSRRGGVGHPDPPLAVDVAIAALAGTLELEDRRSGDGGEVLEGDRLTAEVSRLWLAYLGGAGYERRPLGPDGVDFFDVWG